MHLIWITDPHLNFLPPLAPKVFGERVRRDYPKVDGVLITGDIAEYDSFLPLLDAFQEGVGAPVWYTLGNHDAYGGSILSLQNRAHAHTNPMTRYLEKEGLVELRSDTALVGCDGWYDARLGFEPLNSNVFLSDFTLIHDFLGRMGTSLIETIRAVADNSAQRARVLLETATAKGYKHIFFATHVPPYPQAAWHEGKMSDGNWLPWMTSRCLGTVIDRVAAANPEVSFTVLCGHTHSAGRYQRGKNILVFTGHSKYSDPRVCRDWEF